MLRNLSHLFVGATLIVGLLFKFMHWPYAGGLLIVSLGVIAVLLFEYAIRNRKSKLLSRNIIYPLLGVVYVLGMLFKVMHWPGADTMLVVSII